MSKRSVAAAWNFLINADGGEIQNSVEAKKAKVEDDQHKGVDAEELLHLNDGDKLIICMVGKSSEEKAIIAGKIGRYLSWVGYKIKQFKTVNPDPVSDKMKVQDAVKWLFGGGQVAVLDTKNSTKIERKETLQWLKESFQKKESGQDGLSHRVLWLETYRGNDSNDQAYETLDPKDDNDTFGDLEANSFIKLIDYGKTMVTHNVQGYLESKLASFCVNLHTKERVILLVRHGESMYNTEDRLGGDPALSGRGELFAKELASYIRQAFGPVESTSAMSTDASKDQSKHESLGSYKDLSVWTSQLQRTIQTAKQIQCRAKVPWVSLSEIDAGVCEGMTYKEFKERLFAQYSARQRDKLNWRYPQGESYVDVKKRLEPVIFEAERQRKPLLIVAHRAVLRCLYSYFADIESSETPFLPFPLHTVVVLRSTAGGWDEDRVALDPVPGDTGAHEKSKQSG